MNLENKLRTPSPNKEFRRVSSRNLRKDQSNSPKSASSVRNISTQSVSNDSVGNRISLLPGSVAHKFSPAQYLGHSLSRSTTPAKSVAHTIAFETNYASNIVKLNTPDPLLMSNEKLREFRHAQKATTQQQAAVANSIDYIDLATPSHLAKSPSGDLNAMSPMELSCGDDGSPPPPPPLSPSTPPAPQSLSMESLRRVKDAAAGLITPSISATQRGKPAVGTAVSPSASASLASPVCAAEEEERLRRLRRVHVMLAQYQEAVRSIAVEAEEGRGNTAQLWLPKGAAPSTGTVEVGAEMTAVLQDWCALHSTGVVIAEESVAALNEQRSEHLQLQQELGSTERALAEAGEEHKVLLEQLQAAVRAAEGSWDREALQRHLQAYPASWFQEAQGGEETGSVSISRARSRSEGAVSSAHEWCSRSPVGSARPGSPIWASESQSVTSSSASSGWGPARRLSRSSAQCTAERDSSPNTPQLQHKTVDPAVLPSSEDFAQPWTFKFNPEVGARLAELTVAGHRFYGPPTQERRYRDTYGSVQEGCHSRSSSTGRSRSGSTGRSVCSAPAALRRPRAPSITSAGSGLTLELGLDSDDSSADPSRRQRRSRNSSSSSKLSERSTSATRARAFSRQPDHPGSQRSSSTGRLGQGRDLRAGGPTPRFLQSTQSFLHSAHPTAAEPSAHLDGLERQLQSANVFSASDGQVFSELSAGPEEHLTLQDLSDGSPERGKTEEPRRSEHSADREVRQSSRHQSHSSNRDVSEAVPSAARRSSQHVSSSQRSPGLARSPSNSAASTRFAVMQRDSSMRRYSITTNSSDTSYSGSRYSDVQWDAGAQEFSLGHRAHPQQYSNNRGSMDTVLSTDDESAAGKSAVQVGSLIRGANNQDMSGRAYLDSMHISSSSSSVYSSSRSDHDDREGRQQVPTDAPSQSENRRYSQLGSSTSTEAKVAASPFCADVAVAAASASRPAAREVRPHYAAPLHRAPTTVAAGVMPPWTAHNPSERVVAMGDGLGQLSSTGPAAVSGQFSITRSTTTTTTITAPVVTGSSTRRTTSQPTGTSRPRPKAVRPIATPKVRVPVAAQPASGRTQQEAQRAAQQVRVAVRSEADDYIDSLRRMIQQ